MRVFFRYKTLAIAVASLGAATTAYAAGLDRSGQDVSAFLQDGTYAEAVYTYINADVSGRDNAATNATGGTAGAASAYTQGNGTGDIAETYDFFRYGVKTDVNDRFSVGVLYDEPFGAAVQYGGSSNFVAQDAEDAYAARVGATVAAGIPYATAENLATQLAMATAMTATQLVQSGVDPSAAFVQARTAAATQIATQASATLGTIVTADQVLQLQRAVELAATDGDNAGQGTSVDIRTNNLTTLFGVKLGENRNVQIYGGPAFQRLTGEVHLRGLAYVAASGYDAKISPDQGYGWVAGVSYSKPEIALKAALTYRSKIDHTTTISEVFPALALVGQDVETTRDFKVRLPESYNLDFQTGINPTTLLTAKVRYVPWGDFRIDPPTYNDATALVYNSALPIVSYSKDQWSAEVGLGKKLTDKLSVQGSLGWDSGAGNPVSTLGPIKGYYSVGVGAKYNLTPEWSVSAGAKYLKFGDATAVLPTGDIAGKFEGNDGYALGVKVAYHAK